MRNVVLIIAVVMTTLFASGQGPSKKVVTLTWNASPTPAVKYNMYRSTVSGGPYNLITPTPVTGLTCDDPNVVRGTTYFYVGTATDGLGDESVNSAEAKAVVPQPIQPITALSTAVK